MSRPDESQVDDAGMSLPARVGMLALLYFAGAELGHAVSLKSPGQDFATIWPPAGLLLAVLLRNPYRWWPALLAGACGANLASDVLLHGRTVLVSLGFCLAKCSEACLGAWLLRRLVPAPFTLTMLRDVLALACLSAGASAMLGAALGAGVVTWAVDSASYASAWQAWWIADAVGVLVFAPVVLTWTAETVNRVAGGRASRIAEGVVLFLGMILVVEGVYGEWFPPTLIVPTLVLPFLLWTGFRFEPPGAAVALLVVGMIGIWNTSEGRGPYTQMSAVPHERLAKAQTTLCVISITVLALAAVVAERRQAEQQRRKLIAELEQALAEIKSLRGLIPICAWCKKIRDDQGFWQRLEDYLRTHTLAEITHSVCPECLNEQLAVSKQGEPGA